MSHNVWELNPIPERSDQKAACAPLLPGQNFQIGMVDETSTGDTAGLSARIGRQGKASHGGHGGGIGMVGETSTGDTAGLSAGTGRQGKASHRGHRGKLGLVGETSTGDTAGLEC
jgi:hypothetical protein